MQRFIERYGRLRKMGGDGTADSRGAIAFRASAVVRSVVAATVLTAVIVPVLPVLAPVVIDAVVVAAVVLNLMLVLLVIWRIVAPAPSLCDRGNRDRSGGG